MAVILSSIISVLALLATFYQLYLQRRHNEKSLQPLGQIVLTDRIKRISIHLYNNGLGPLIIDQLLFIKGDQVYTTIQDCLSLEPKSYMHIFGDESPRRVVLPNAYLVIFEKNFSEHSDEAQLDLVRNQLTPIKLKVDGRDIYDNKTTLERDFKWFSRYMQPENPTGSSA